MANSDDDLPGVLEELRRRRVGRVVVAYLACAFAVLEIAGWVLPWFGSMEGGFRPVLGIVVLGFPVAIVLAWTYDVTEGHIVRTPDDLAGAEPEAAGSGWLVLTVIAVVAGVLAQLLRTR